MWEHPDNLPRHKKATYIQIVDDIRNQKEDPYRVRATVGGNRIFYSGPTRTPTADVITFKIFANIIVSTPNAKFMYADIKKLLSK